MDYWRDAIANISVKAGGWLKKKDLEVLTELV
jgi:hypothetical protein